MPEPEKSPAIIVPAVMMPSDARDARITDEAQLGIRPNTAAIAWLITGVSRITEASASSPMKKTVALMRSVTSRMKRLVVIVW